ncbi:MAG: hypothetical protein ACFCUQ_06785 [Kiloniellales bacterium]
MPVTPWAARKDHLQGNKTRYLELTMSGDLLYAVVFALVASLVLVPSLVAIRSEAIARWDRRYRRSRLATRPYGLL